MPAHPEGEARGAHQVLYKNMQLGALILKYELVSKSNGAVH